MSSRARNPALLCLSALFMDRLNDRPAALLDLLRGYATLCPVRLLVFPSHLAFGVVHDFLLHDLLNEPFVSYPPAAEYQARFWKWALDHLQRMDCQEVCVHFCCPQ